MSIRRKRIESLAHELLQNNKILEPPVPVESIARASGLQIFMQPLDSDLSGILVRNDDAGVVGVNSNHALVRQRFTIAHELGHFLLHRGEPVHVDRAVQAKFRSTLSSQGTDPEEIEANLFAAELLLPREFLARDLHEVPAVDILDDEFVRDLAKRYNVSAQALMLRLCNLGYVDQ